MNKKINSAGISKITGESKYHGKKKHPLYGRWLGIKKRCYKNYDKSYKNYGGKGIYVCDEWLCDFKIFYDWCMANGYKKELEIDRIDSSGPYAPWNCRFISKFKNTQNRKTKNKYFGVPYNRFRNVYVVKITLQKETLFYQRFENEEEAALARDIFILKNNLPHKMNFPDRIEEFKIKQ